MSSGPSQTLPKIVLSAALLVMSYAVLNLVLAYRSLTAPMDSSEFAALRNMSLGIMAFLVVVLSLLAFLAGALMLRSKRWAYIVALLTTVLIIPVLAVSDLNELQFELIAGAPLSVNHELVPVLLLVLLLFCWRKFAKKV